MSKTCFAINNLTPLLAGCNADAVPLDIWSSRAATLLVRLLGPSINGKTLFIVSANAGKSLERNDSTTPQASLACSCYHTVNIITKIYVPYFNHCNTSPITWSKFSSFTLMYPCPLVVNEMLWFVALSMHKCPLSDRNRGLKSFGFDWLITCSYITPNMRLSLVHDFHLTHLVKHFLYDIKNIDNWLIDDTLSFSPKII